MPYRREIRREEMKKERHELIIWYNIKCIKDNEIKEKKCLNGS